jgi:Protein of unknown function (DUF3237)
MSLPVPHLLHIADLTIRVAPPIEIGEVPGGVRRVIAIEGGEISGPRLKGKVLPGGADFQIIRAGGLTELHARYVIELDQGELVYVENSGIRHGPAEAMERLRRGEPVDPAAIYFRTVPKFETSAAEYRWMIEHVFVGSGARFPDRVELAVFQLS